MASRNRRHGGNGLDAWPGYVDALSTLLMVVMFVLLVFVMAQAFETVVLSKRNEQLSVSRTQNEALRGSVASGDAARTALMAQLRDLNRQTAHTVAERDKLSSTLKEVEAAVAAAAIVNAGLTTDLNQKSSDINRMRNDAAAAEKRMREMRAQMDALDKTVKADKATIDAKLSDLARLAEQVTALNALRDQLRTQVKTAAAASLTEQQIRQAVEAKLADEQQIAGGTKARIALLTQQVDQLRGELSVSERRRADEQDKAVGLNEQLNLALAAQVEELRKYRSEFFGKLRAVLSGKPGVAVVGDRFVFQSEVLFGVSSAELTPAGTAQMADLAATIQKIIEEIPPDVSWVLRVDGHTDAIPVRTSRFASNWELSAARAITVVKFLSARGIPPEHLAATGFGEYQPVDRGDTAEAFAKNRRIELRLTDR